MNNSTADGNNNLSNDSEQNLDYCVKSTEMGMTICLGSESPHTFRLVFDEKMTQIWLPWLMDDGEKIEFIHKVVSSFTQNDNDISLTEEKIIILNNNKVVTLTQKDLLFKLLILFIKAGRETEVLNILKLSTESAKA